MSTAEPNASLLYVCGSASSVYKHSALLTAVDTAKPNASIKLSHAEPNAFMFRFVGTRRYAKHAIHDIDYTTSRY